MLSVRYAVLAGAQLAVGAAAIFARFALGGAQPLAIAALRLCIAAALVYALSLFRREPRRVQKRQRIALAAAGIFLALHFATWIWSLEYTTVAISTLLVTTTPAFTLLYDTATGTRRSPRQVWLALAAAAFGLVLVVGFQGAAAPVAGHGALGVTLALAGAASIGAYFICVRTVRDALGTHTIVTHTYAWAAAALALGALIARQPPPPLAASGAWFGIIAMALVSQMIGHTALNASLRWFTPSGIATATLLEPVFAALLALAIFHEAISAAAVAGGVIVLGAIAVVLQYEQTGAVTEVTL